MARPAGSRAGRGFLLRPVRPASLPSHPTSTDGAFLVAASTLTVSALVTELASATLAATSSLTVIGGILFSGDATLNAASTFAGAGTVTDAGSVTIAGVATLTTSGTAVTVIFVNAYAPRARTASASVGNVWLLAAISDRTRSSSATATVLMLAPAPAVKTARVLVGVYAEDGTTLISWIPRRRAVQWQDEMNSVGTGSFEVNLDDPLIRSMRSQLFVPFNIVKFYLNGTLIKSWVVEDIAPVNVSSSERAGRVMKISGRGNGSVLDAGGTYAEYGLRDNSSEDRFFNFASKDGPWRDVSTWTKPVGIEWRREALRGRKGQPKGWPDKYAQWIWSTNPEANSAVGRNWFRSTFTLTARTDVIVFMSCDNHASVFLDGENIMISDPTKGSNYRSLYRHEIVLAAGTHTIGAWCDNKGSAANPAGLLITVVKADAYGRPTTQVVSRSHPTTWQVRGYGTPPGWRGATILQQLVQEAQDRGVDSLAPVTFGFTNTNDSSGLPWVDVQDRLIKVGTDQISNVVTQIVEAAIDIDLGPDFVLRAWKKRGTDLSATVRIMPTRDVISSAPTIRASRVRNQAIARSAQGWIELFNSTSKEKYGRREVGLNIGNAGSASQTQQIGTAAIREVSDVETTFPVTCTSLTGPQPYADFNLGDTITVPDDQRAPTAARLMSLTGAEQENYIQWDLDFYPDKDTDVVDEVVLSSGASNGDPNALYRADVLSDGPWGFWRLQEIKLPALADISGHKRTMTAHGTGMILAYNGPIASAMEFASGTAVAYGLVGSPTINAHLVTLEAWVRLTTTITQIVPILNVSDNTTATGGHRITTIGIDGNQRAYLYQSSSLTAGHQASWGTVLSLGTWYHLVGSVGPSGMRFYVNGDLVATNTYTSNVSTLGYVYLHDSSSSVEASHAKMRIAEPAVYQKQLTDTRVASHYASSLGTSIVNLATGSPALVQQVYYVAPAVAGGTTTLSAQDLAAANSVIVVAIRKTAGQTMTVSGYGGTWSRAVGTATDSLQIWVGTGFKTTSGSISLTAGGGTYQASMTEWSGLSGQVLHTSSASGNSNNPSVGSLTSSPGCIALGMFATDNTISNATASYASSPFAWTRLDYVGLSSPDPDGTHSATAYLLTTSAGSATFSALVSGAAGWNGGAVLLGFA